MKRMVTALVLAAAAPTAASAHEFVVYFGFDSAVVPEGHFTQSMLDAARHAVWGDTDVYVVARADSAGPAAYNLAPVRATREGRGGHPRPGGGQA
jgi:outer membrane protein OmpA-like peptidoglycan-associated protein